jgi:two-component system chemotaxis sensor kinase CheA
MSLNHLAISLIELDPDNLSELEKFKEKLALNKEQAGGNLKNILERLYAETEAMLGEGLESRRAAVVRLGELLEQAMEINLEEDHSLKQRKHKETMSWKKTTRHFTLSKDFDSNLLSEFVAENMEWTAMAESAILDWEKKPDSRELLNTIFRSFHTIKGTSSFLNLDCVKDLAHQAESMLSRVRDGEDNFTTTHADLALKSLDVIKSILERMKSSEPGQKIQLPPDHEVVLENLKSFVSGTNDHQLERLPGLPVTPPDHEESQSKDDGDNLADHNMTGMRKTEQPAETTVRVKVDRLDKLLDTVGELVIAQTMVGQDEILINGGNHELNKKILHAGKIVRELHDLSMFLRMVPLKGTFQKMMRLARDLSHKHGKMVKFITEGDDIEIDRSMVDLLSDPLIHLIRNAIDHGIERSEERQRMGKPERGSVCLTAGRVEGSMMITVWDDGRGMSRQAIADKAIARGLIESAERMSDQEIWQMIFLPGFSTAEEVTETSGRGVGMDVVRQAVESLRGRIEVQATEGHGCAFIMKMPLTMAITDGMIVRVGSQRYILPMADIQKAVKIKKSDIHTVNQRAEMFLFREELIPVIRLHRLFNIHDARTDLASGLLVVIGEGSQRCALFVDDLLSQTQVVTKLLGKGINHVPGIAGGAIMGDGTVGLILDASGIVSQARQQ